MHEGLGLIPGITKEKEIHFFYAISPISLCIAFGTGCDGILELLGGCDRDFTTQEACK